MPALPILSGRKAVRAFEKLGWQIARQRGSHIILRQLTYPHRRIVVPDHKEVAKGTLRSIIRETGLTVDEFKKLL